MRKILPLGYGCQAKAATALTAVIQEIILPEDGDRNVHGNVSFNSQYVHKILKLCVQTDPA